MATKVVSFSARHLAPAFLSKETHILSISPVSSSASMYGELQQGFQASRVLWVGPDDFG